ncbi:hypothetical protein T03_9853 [Trichinella britovi]|uniref:Uncharacterized protein n=1 Tax=Trichinella britovi TaxID=45882 RepID=A0A0V1D033_TRIBR|nr:hypothetical protein T03_9853 [Trichinella britovi]
MSKVMKNDDTLGHLSVSDGCKFPCFLSLQRAESRFFTRSWIDAMPFPVVKS